MSDGYLTTLVQELLSENGELSAELIADTLGVPVGNVRILLYCRKCFHKNPETGRWGLLELTEV